MIGLWDMRMLVDMHSRGATALRASTAEHAKVLGPDAAAAPPTVATFQLGSLLPGLVRRRCYESRRESKVTRRGKQTAAARDSGITTERAAASCAPDVLNHAIRREGVRACKLGSRHVAARSILA